MRFVSYLDNGTAQWGKVVDGQVFPANGSFPSLKLALTALGPDRLGEAFGNDGAGLPLGSVSLLPPIPDADKVLCIGLNYADHIAEMGRERSANPVVFTRFNNSLVGHEASLIAPVNSVQFDFEGELAVIIGTGGRHISRDTALNHVFGYSIFNDGSVRDFQRHTHQFTPGKNFPNSGSFGPEVVSKEELGELGELGISTLLNGETVQRSTLGQLAFSIADIIVYVSEWTRLEPGDVIATGTPGGVGDGREPKLWMRPGDVCEVRIEGIGALKNPIEADRFAS